MMSPPELHRKTAFRGQFRQASQVIQVDLRGALPPADFGASPLSQLLGFVAADVHLPRCEIRQEFVIESGDEVKRLLVGLQDGLCGDAGAGIGVWRLAFRQMLVPGVAEPSLKVPEAVEVWD